MSPSLHPTKSWSLPSGGWRPARATSILIWAPSWWWLMGHRRWSPCPSGRVTSSNLLALGYSNQGIGRKRFTSVRTVDAHRAHIMRKLGLETRAELVLFALANGLIGPS
jgi:Bacterial regulatory proteins, luxR family